MEKTIGQNNSGINADMKLISVIIPLYNHAETLLNSVRSVLGQTYRPHEIIIVNDGSTDNPKNTLHEVRELCDKYDISLKMFTRENRGAPAARNFGFEQAQGDYVIFWDADTTAVPGMLEQMLTVLEKNPSAGYAYCAYRFGWKTMKSFPFNSDLLKKMNYIDTTSLMRWDVFVGFDETLKRFQDWDLWLSLLEKKITGIFIPEVLFKKEVGRRKGISGWVPSFLYKFPWKTGRIKDYEKARDLVLHKHGLSPQP